MLLVAAGAGEDLMNHGVGGIFAFIIGSGRCGFVGMLKRVDAGEDAR